MNFCFAMVMLGPDAEISPEAVETALAELRGNSTKPKWNSEKTDGCTFTLDVGTEFVAIGRMPAPIPWSDLEGPCATSIFWDNATEEVQSHVEHLIVTVAGDNELLERMRLLTQSVAATLMACSQAIGVYWGNACLVLPSSLFISFAKEVLPEELPIPIWVDCRIAGVSAGKTSGFTCGMKAFGQMEIETENAFEAPADLHNRLMGLVSYLLVNGPVIQDGETMGTTATEKIRVVYADSAFGHEGKVMRLEYPESVAKKPWWKLW